MDIKAASILKILIALTVTFPAQAVEKDWASIVLALKPKQGQNFEQDLQLAKALFSLERRIEAIEVLNEYEEPRAAQMLHLVSTQFYNQETATLYYEGLRLVGLTKWAEAREKLEPAAAKEPGNSLVLLRLIQVELILKQRSSALEHLKLAQELDSVSKELKLYAARAALDGGDDKEAYRILSSLKSIVQTNQTLTVWWFETLLKTKRTGELLALQTKFLKEHPGWSYALDWWVKSKQLSLKDQMLYQAQIEKNLADETKFNQDFEAEGKKTQYLWAGYYSLDSLKPPAKPQ